MNFARALDGQSAPGFRFIYIVPKPLRELFDQRVGGEAITPVYSGLNQCLYYISGNTSYLCKLPKYNLYHYLHFYSPWGPKNAGRNKSLLTVHDFHALERRRSRRRLLGRLRQVGNLAFISRFALGEYCKHIPTQDHQIRVIVNGVKVPQINSEAEVARYKKQYGEFLFTLGGLPRKNIHSLVGMMQEIKHRKNVCQLKLLVAGGIKEKYKKKLVALARQKGVYNQIVFLGSVSESEKFSYMQACCAFVFPSLQEGFGLPVIEALHFGKPVFCSDKTSLPEVGGDKVYYWRSFDACYMADILQTGLEENKTSLSSCIAVRKRYAREFDWNINASKYIDYYEEILQ